MRILHIVTLVSADGAYGGPLTVAMNQGRELRRRGHLVTIAAAWLGSNPPPREVGGVSAALFPAVRVMPGVAFATLVSPRLLAWIWRRVREYDIVHVHASRDLVPLTAAAVAAIRGVPYVTQTHGMIVPDRRLAARLLDLSATRRMLRHARRNFVLTPAEERHLAEVMHTSRRLDLLGNGVTVQPAPASPSNPPEVLFCARLHPRKRVLVFADVAHAILTAGYDVDFRIVGPDAGDLPLLRSKLRRIDSDRIRYEGALPPDAVLDRMRRALVYVLPSVEEPYAMSLLEALSLGIPSVCTESCGLAAELKHRQAAVVSAPDVESLASAVRSLLDSADERRRLSDAAVQVTRDVFSITHICDVLEHAYAEAVRGEERRR